MSTLARPLVEAARSGYLDTPSMGLPSSGTVEAMGEALRRWGCGEARYPEWEADEAEARVLWASAVDVRADDVGTMPNTSPAVAAIVRSWHTAGRKVVAHRDEFRSLLLPALAFVADEDIVWVDGRFSSAAFQRVCSDEVDLVLASSVSSMTGERIDLGAVADASHKVGARLLVDSTQSEGVIDIGPYRLYDAVVAAAYKGLTCPRGTGFAYVRAEHSLTPVAPSPYGMSDRDKGAYGPPLSPQSGGGGLTQSPAWLSWAGAKTALASLGAVSAVQRQEHALGLARSLVTALTESGIATMPSELPSSIVCIPVDNAPSVADRLNAVGLRCAARGRFVRAGFHFYNSLEDVERLVRELRAMPDHTERNQQ